MGKKELQNVMKEKERVEAVMDLLRKQQTLTVKQEKFCNDACVERFLKAKGDNVKKAAKQLRSCLAWRNSLAIDHLIADEFSAEVAEGAAYVSGHDDESRPILIFRIKQDYQKSHSQKLLNRLLVFTLEVAIQTMAKGIEQFVILFDASFFKSASAFMNMLLPTLKIITDYYPGRLHKAFVIDPPPLFSYLWKGVKAFIEVAAVTMIVSSLEFEEFTTTISPNNKMGSSSRFAFTVSHHSFDSHKPWSLTLTGTPSSKTISPLNARSYSFASPMARMTPRGSVKKGFFPSTPLPQKTQDPRATKTSFFQSPAMFFKKDCQVSKNEKCREWFLPYLKFYRRPYDEMTYRSKMRPPLGGLISIVSPHIIRRHHISLSQRY